MNRKLITPLATAIALFLGASGAWPAVSIKSIDPKYVMDSPTIITITGEGVEEADSVVEVKKDSITTYFPVADGHFSGSIEATFSTIGPQTFTVQEFSTEAGIGLGSTATDNSVIYDNEMAEVGGVTSAPSTVNPGEKVTITVKWTTSAGIAANPMDTNAPAEIRIQTLDGEFLAKEVTWGGTDTLTGTFTVPDNSTAGPTIINAIAYTKCGVKSIQPGNPGFTIESALTTKPKQLNPTDKKVINSTTPTFFWDGTTGAVRYELQIDDTETEFEQETPDFDFIQQASSPFQLPDGVALNGTTYYWRVEAFDTGNNSMTSEALFSFSVYTDPIVITEPAEAFRTNNSRPAFTWEAISDDTDTTKNDWRVQLQISMVSSFETLHPASSGWLAPTVSTYTADASLSVDGVYYWQVVAKDGVGDHTTDINIHLNNVSAQRTLIYDTEGLLPPDLVSPATGTVTKDQPIKFTWSKVYDAVSYVIEIDPSGSDFNHTAANPLLTAEVTATSTVGATVETYSTNLLIDEKLYRWRVMSRDNTPPMGNLSNPSTIWSLRVDRTPAPVGGIVLVKPDNDDISNDNTPLFKWTHEYETIPGEGDQAHSYTIQWSDSRLFDSTNTHTYDFTPSSEDKAGFWSTTGTILSGDNVTKYLSHDNYRIYLLAADDKVMAVDIKDKTNRKIDTLTGIGVGLVGTSSTTGLRIKNLSSNSYGDIAEASITVQTVKGSFNFEWEFDDTNYTALTDGVWYWRVKPVDEAGNQGSSEWWSYDNKFTIDTAAPEPPVIDSPQNGQMITATTIDVLISLLGSDASQVKVYGVNTVAAGNVSSSSIDEANLIGGPVDVPVGATTVTITVELSPIDGTKTIAATAIDKAGNVSEPSVPVSFILDRTDPKINQLVIQSYNPGSGSVTDPDWSGKLLVIVEYSEEMDSSTEPTVTVTPDNGSGEGLTAIGMASLGLGAKSWSDTGTTWTGMVRIPKGPGYDGLATVTVGGQCKDLAGKVARSRMFPGYFSIDTAPRFTIRIFYNPADERDVIIGLEASEPLRLTPSCQVTVAGQKFDIMMNHISQYMYTGVHRLTTDQVGRLDVQVFGTDLAGNTGEQTKSFTLGRITVFKGGVLASADGKLEIAVPAGAVEEDKLVAFLPAFETANEAVALKQFGQTAAKQSSSIKSAARQGLVMAGPAHNLGPSTVEFIDSYTAKGHLDNEQQGEIPPIDKIGVYLFSGGVWNYLGAIREDENTIAAKGRGTGLLALMADLRKPEVAQTYPDEGEAMDTAQSQIEVWIDESGSGVDPASIKVMINGRKVKHSFETAGNHISFKPAHPLAEGDHELAVELSDKAGNSLGKVLVPLQSPGQFRFDSLKNYPNPVNPQMNDVTISYIFNQNTSRIDIDIFDITGDLVRSFQDATQPAAAGVVGDEDWDCTNDFGEAVANGVYIYRIKAINAAGDSSSERTGKIAVLR